MYPKYEWQMCKWPIDRSPIQSQQVKCHQFTFTKLVIVMPQANSIQMGEHDHK
jgi:hypothetical protein